MMNRRTIAKNYAFAGAIITTIFVVLLSILDTNPIMLNAEPIRNPALLIGLALIGLVTGIITLFVAVDLCRKKDKVTSSNWYVTRPVVRDIQVAGAFTVLTFLLISEVYRNDYEGEVLWDFLFPIFLMSAIVHYFLNYLAEKLENPSTPLYLSKSDIPKSNLPRNIDYLISALLFGIGLAIGLNSGNETNDKWTALYLFYLGILFIFAFFHRSQLALFRGLIWICENHSYPASSYMAFFYAALCIGLAAFIFMGI